MVGSSSKLGVAFNACLRYVHGIGRRESVADLQCSITGLNLKDSATLQQLKFLFKIIHTQHPSHRKKSTTGLVELAAVMATDKVSKKRQKLFQIS
jgi:hypothetical protein